MRAEHLKRSLVPCTLAAFCYSECSKGKQQVRCGGFAWAVPITFAHYFEDDFDFAYALDSWSDALSVARPVAEACREAKAKVVIDAAKGWAELLWHRCEAQQVGTWCDASHFAALQGSHQGAGQRQRHGPGKGEG